MCFGAVVLTVSMIFNCQARGPMIAGLVSEKGALRDVRPHRRDIYGSIWMFRPKGLYMSSVSHHVAVSLSAHVPHVFGVMGNGNAYFLDALLRETETRFTAVRHEVGAVVAADAYYRNSLGIAAATATYGAGFTNTLTALTEASMASSPLILVVGAEPTTGTRPWDVDQDALATAVGVRTFTVDRSAPARATHTATEHALTHSQPVVLEIPYDIAASEAGPVLADKAIRLNPRALPEHTTARWSTAIQKLRQAKRPLLLAGRGAHIAGASEALGQLARATGAVTASTALARGIFPEQHYDLGATGGFGAPAAMELIQEADVAVVVGASLNQFTMRFGELFSPTTHVVQVDTRSAPTNSRVDTHLQGDAREVSQMLLEALDSNKPSGWRDSVEAAELRRQDPGESLAPDGLLDPRSAAARIGELLPADTVTISDGGHFIGWANMYWPVQAPGNMIMVGTAFQSIGLGFPGAAGVAAASHASTIALTTGDGGGLMALADLETAVRTAGGRGLCMVWNDAAYGAEVHLYGGKGLQREPMLIPETNFAALAESFGAESAVVRTLDDLRSLEHWLDRDVADRGFLLLDLRVSPAVVAPYQQEVIHANS